MLIVGRRLEYGDAWADQGRLARTAAFLRGCGLAPRGVFRFSSFEEADAWMTKMMIATLERRSPATLIRTKDTHRPQDALDRAFLEGVLRARGA
jgi:hypothetical protein